MKPSIPLKMLPMTIAFIKHKISVSFNQLVKSRPFFKGNCYCLFWDRLYLCIMYQLIHNVSIFVDLFRSNCPYMKMKCYWRCSACSTSQGVHTQCVILTCLHAIIIRIMCSQNNELVPMLHFAPRRHRVRWKTKNLG